MLQLVPLRFGLNLISLISCFDVECKDFLFSTSSTPFTPCLNSFNPFLMKTSQRTWPGFCEAVMFTF